MWLPPPQGLTENEQDGYHHRKGKMWKGWLLWIDNYVARVEGDVESCRIKSCVL